MDHQWRPMPAYGNICPVCSMSHFPFCPPPPPHSHPFPPFNQNPRFAPPPPPPEYPPPEPYFADGWQRNPNSNYSREDFAPPIFDYGNGYNVTNNGYVDRSYKRPRVEETGSGAYSGRGLADEERRLKLIRDHGGGGAGALGNAEMNGPRDGGSDLYSPFQPDGSNQPAAARDESYSQSVKYHNSQQDQYLHMGNPQDYRPPQPYGTPQYMRPPDYHSPAPFMDPRQVTEANRGSNMPRVGQYGVLNEERVFTGHLPPPPPPLPVSPPPPPPFEHPRSEFDAYSSPPKTSFSLFPVPFSAPESNPYLHNKPLSHVSTNLFPEEQKNSSLRQYLGEDRPFLPKQLSPEKPTAVDASCLFKQPHRATRPDHFVIILRGLPGSGKSYLAKMMRDLEVENGSNAPRIHSMDDYFMTEVEKVEEGDVSKSSGFIRGKKLTVKKVIEYCYEPEMEEAYRDSMLKAFKKTLEEGLFTFVIVDDRNLRVADFAQFWAIAKRSGYEVYVSEATYKDPAGCAARNVHGFTLDQIEKMAAQWEDVPPLYLKLDIKSLFHGDDLKESAIQEVDMDTEDGGFDNDPSTFQECKPEDANHHSVEDNAAYVPLEDGEKRWDAEEVHPGGKVKELGNSKWSNDLDEDRVEGSENVKGDLHALSGLMQAYKKRRNSVHWSDQGANTGFSIGAAKKANILSLVIGPGAGYNLKSNPLHEEESKTLARNIGKSSGQSIFQEQLRAERESFKAVFDRRRQRIGGFDLDEE